MIVVVRVFGTNVLVRWNGLISALSVWPSGRQFEILNFCHCIPTVMTANWVPQHKILIASALKRALGPNATPGPVKPSESKMLIN